MLKINLNKSILNMENTKMKKWITPRQIDKKQFDIMENKTFCWNEVFNCSSKTEAFFTSIKEHLPKRSTFETLESLSLKIISYILVEDGWSLV